MVHDRREAGVESLTIRSLVTWNQKFLDWLGHPLPDDYLAFDCETNGLKRDWALPLDIGYCLVRERQPVLQGNYVLNWFGWPNVEDDWLDYTLKKTAYHMADRGKPFRYTEEFIRRHGDDPARVLKFFWDLFVINRQAGAAFVGHNAWFFDSELLQNIMWEACDLKWTFGENELYDTGGMEKALRAGDLEPFPDETTLKDYFMRVHHAYRRGVKWNTDACVQRYNLLERFNLDAKHLHGAGEDAFVAHLLFEEHRRTE